MSRFALDLQQLVSEPVIFTETSLIRNYVKLLEVKIWKVGTQQSSETKYFGDFKKFPWKHKMMIVFSVTWWTFFFQCACLRDSDKVKYMFG